MPRDSGYRKKKGFLIQGQAVPQAVPFQGPVNGDHHLFAVDRLDQVVVGAELHGLNGARHIVDGGHDNALHRRKFLLDPLKDLHAAYMGHDQVLKHQSKPEPAKKLENLPAVRQEGWFG